MDAPQTGRPPRWIQLAAILFGLILLSTAVSYFTAVWMMRGPEWKHDQPDGHAWLKQELGLTPEEAARIDAFETDYREKRAEFEREFNRRIAELAGIIRQHDGYTRDVTVAVHALHDVHGRLQQLAIQHYYDMFSVLPPDKQVRMRELAVEALSEPD